MALRSIFCKRLGDLRKSEVILFKHGLKNSSQEKHQVYYLDFDFYEENVSFESVPSMVTQFNLLSFRFLDG